MKDRPNKTITRLFIFCSTVGYQSIDSTQETKLLTTTFIKVDGTNKKLDDFKPQSTAAAKNWGPANFYINLYNAAGAQSTVKNDTEILRLYKDIADDKTICDAAVQFYYEKRSGKPEGWYLTADTSYNYPMGNYQLKDGDGFLMFVGKNMSTVTLTYSGEVDQKDLPLSVNTETILTGNVTPTTIKLGKIILSSSATAKNWGPANFYINFYNAAGAQSTVKEDPEILRLYKDIGDDKTICDAAVQFYYEKRSGKPEGWYLTADTGYNYPMAEYQIPAGAGFLLFSGKNMGDLTVTLPGVDLQK